MKAKKLGVVDVTVKDAGAGASGNGEFEAILSAPTLDRDGEVIAAKAFEPLPASIVIHVDHTMSVDTAIARAVPRYEGDVLVARGFFGSDARAQSARQKIMDGIITTMSVGFMNAEREDVGGITYITKGELLEASFVSIPSNRDALVLSAKSGARNSTKDNDRLQSIHDLAVENGAICKHTDSEARAETPADDPEKAAAPAAAKSPGHLARVAVALAEVDALSVL